MNSPYRDHRLPCDRPHHTPRRRAGFTLLEVLLVLMILGMLVTVAVMTLGGQGEKAKAQAARIQVDKLESLIDQYNLAIGHYPSEEEGGLQALVVQPQFDDETLADKWAGPYAKARELKDPWGQDLNYEVLDPSEYEQYGGVRFKLWSNGPDRQSDTEDDICNWDKSAVNL